MKKKILVFLWIQHKKKDVFFYTWYGFPLYLYYLNIDIWMGMEYYLNNIVYSCFFIIKRIFLFIVYYRIDCKEMDEDEVYINYIKLNLNYYKLYLQELLK